MKNISIALFVIIGLTRIDLNAQTFTTQLGGNCFTLAIPDYMTKTYELNDAATLQYLNTQKEAYVIVIDDDKDQLEELGVKFTNSKHFLEFFTKDYLVDAQDRSLGAINTFEIRTSNLAQTELTWIQDELSFFMLITTMETEKHFYKILCWTLRENKDDLIDDFKKIASSLME